jgi:hypothetical protein
MFIKAGVKLHGTGFKIRCGVDPVLSEYDSFDLQIWLGYLGFRCCFGGFSVVKLDDAVLITSAFRRCPDFPAIATQIQVH